MEHARASACGAVTAHASADRRAVPVEGRGSGARGAFIGAAPSPWVKGAAPMNAITDPQIPQFRLPHHRLVAFGVARDLLVAVLACRIADPKLRDEAHRSAKSACLNCAEGAGRVTRADKARAFAIARAEAVEAAAAVEIAAHCAARFRPRRPARSPGSRT